MCVYLFVYICEYVCAHVHVSLDPVHPVCDPVMSVADLKSREVIAPVSCKSEQVIDSGISVPVSDGLGFPVPDVAVLPTVIDASPSHGSPPAGFIALAVFTPVFAEIVLENHGGGVDYSHGGVVLDHCQEEVQGRKS